MKISAVLITYNEEANIADAIKSLPFADEIIVVDSESTDATCQIANGLGAKVITKPWAGFASQKQFATDSAANDWIFSLDADERVSPDLGSEITQLFSSDVTADGYSIPRLSYYMGRQIRHGGWYPDRQLRLFDRRKARWKPMLIHESVEMLDDAAIGKLHGDILHFSVRNTLEHHKMIGERYAPLAARAMYENGRRASFRSIAFAGPLAFIRAYLIKLGFLDGLPGLVIASFGAYHAFLKQIFLRAIQNGEIVDNTDKPS